LRIPAKTDTANVVGISTKFQCKRKKFNPSTVIKTDVKTMYVINAAFDRSHASLRHGGGVLEKSDM
jgi:hypothetical protein